MDIDERVAIACKQRKSDRACIYLKFQSIECRWQWDRYFQWIESERRY
ncbi:MAG: hypothetical protein AB1861_18670 [Cyanobacteriota bacterium]